MLVSTLVHDANHMFPFIAQSHHLWGLSAYDIMFQLILQRLWLVRLAFMFSLHLYEISSIHTQYLNSSHSENYDHFPFEQIY